MAGVYQNTSPDIVPLGLFDLEGLFKGLLLVELAGAIRWGSILLLRLWGRRWRLVSIVDGLLLAKSRVILRRWTGRMAAPLVGVVVVAVGLTHCDDG